MTTNPVTAVLDRAAHDQRTNGAPELAEPPAPRWTVGPGRALIFDGATVAFVDIPPYPATYYPHELDALTRATVDALNAANVDGSAILRPDGVPGR